MNMQNMMIMRQKMVTMSRIITKALMNLNSMNKMKTWTTMIRQMILGKI